MRKEKDSEHYKSNCALKRKKLVKLAENWQSIAKRVNILYKAMEQNSKESKWNEGEKTMLK